MALFYAYRDNVSEGAAMEEQRKNRGSFQLFSSVNSAVVTSNRMSVGNSTALISYSGGIKGGE